MMIGKIFPLLGAYVLGVLASIGKMGILAFETFTWSFKPPYRLRLLLKQIEFAGIRSLPVIILTGTSTGMVLALQSYIGLSRYGPTYLTGALMAISMTRELGPVLSAIMVASRAGSAMAAEIGTMKVSEQVDALKAIAVEPVHYLIVPRVVACIIVMPLLNTVAIICGLTGGYLLSVFYLGVNKTLYVEYMYFFLELDDYMSGMVKSVVFGFLLSFVSCYKGYNAGTGAEGVGNATTEAVVLSCVLILISDYILTAILF